MKAEVVVQPGYILEPGSRASVEFAGAKVQTEVAKDDFSFVGSPSGKKEVTTEVYDGHTVAQFLALGVNQSTATESSGNADVESVFKPAHEIIFAHAGRIDVGGMSLRPLVDRTLGKAGFATAKVSAHVRPLKADPEKDGQQIIVDLAKGFLTGKEGQSMAGWRVEVGYRGGASQNNEWIGGDPVKANADGTPATTLKLALPNTPEALAAETKLELRVFNAEGVPAKRILIPLSELTWGT